MKEWNYFDKVYRIWVVVLVCSPAELREFLEAEGYTEFEKINPEASTGQMIEINPDNSSRSGTYSIIWLREWRTSTLVHEIAHLVHFTLDAKGIPTDRYATEASAYYQEFWFLEITRGRKRWPHGRSSMECRKSR